MSSTISTTEVKGITPRPVTRLKSEDKKVKLVRTSSMEKIKRFNSYICSQHYYIVPALLTWLKSSHFALQNSAEKTIYFFRSLIFNAFFYRVLQNIFKLKTIDVRNIKMSNILPYIPNFYNIFTNTFESTFVLYLTYYLTSFLVFSQILMTVYLLSHVHIPVGLYFLLISSVYITYLTCSLFLVKKKALKKIN